MAEYDLMTDEGLRAWNEEQNRRQAEVAKVIDEAERRQRRIQHEDDVRHIHRVANDERERAARWLRANVNQHRKELGLPSLIEESIAEFKREMAKMGEAARETAKSWRAMMAQVDRDLS